MSFATFKSFDKKHFKSFGRVKKPKEFKAPRVTNPDETSVEFDRVRRLLDGDEKQTKRVMALKRQYPDAPVTEMIVMDYLNRAGVQYVFQGSAYGGKRVHGGLIPDFVVPNKGYGMVIQVQGDYWHSIARKGFADKNVRLKLLGHWVNGIKVKTVMEVWESDLYHGKVNNTMRLALAGISLR